MDHEALLASLAITIQSKRRSLAQAEARWSKTLLTEDCQEVFFLRGALRGLDHAVKLIEAARAGGELQFGEAERG